MNRRLASFLLVLLGSLPSPARAEPAVAPSLEEEGLVGAASDELDAILASLDPGTRARLSGTYVAVDASAEGARDVAALPACDDDGDHVVVLTAGLVRLAGYVARAAASDAVRGTELVAAYGPLLARAQSTSAPPLPPPVDGDASRAAFAVPTGDAASAVARDLLAWVVADTLAFAVRGDVACPHPTVTRESGDDVWTPSERGLALSLAAPRTRDLAGADAWAAAQLLATGRSLAPAIELLEVLAPLEEARAGRPAPSEAWVYLALYPGAHARAGRLRRAAEEARSESSRAASRMK